MFVDTEAKKTFSIALAEQVPMLKRNYQRGINKDLSAHNSESLFARQVNNLIDALLHQSSELLTAMVEENTPEYAAAEQQQKSQLWRESKSATAKQKDTLVEYAYDFNRSSCALSNFPAEHLPSSVYVSEVLIQVEQKWQSWCDDQEKKIGVAA